MPQVRIYTTRTCGYCVAAKNLLANKGLAFNEISVDGDPVRRRELVVMSGRHTVPQIWVGETHVGGYDDLRRLEQQGELDRMIAGQG
ncbi:MAG: glutaredoxin 3 [Gammaproteobacteria bacterium]|nr:MAG: glutaredoxin 3 [Gammaproteobacteria bacterium]